MSVDVGLGVGCAVGDGFGVNTGVGLATASAVSVGTTVGVEVVPASFRQAAIDGNSSAMSQQRPQARCTRLFEVAYPKPSDS